jgi:hypothetical protein
MPSPQRPPPAGCVARRDESAHQRDHLVGEQRAERAVVNAQRFALQYLRASEVQYLRASEPSPLNLVHEVVLGSAPATQPAQAAGWLRISGCISTFGVKSNSLLTTKT